MLYQLSYTPPNSAGPDGGHITKSPSLGAESL